MNDSVSIKTKTMENQTQSSGQKTSNPVDVLVVIAVIFWFLTATGMFTLRDLVPNWYETPLRFLQTGTDLIIGLIPVLLALTIRNKNLKVIALIFGIFLSIFLIYRNLYWLLGLGY